MNILFLFISCIYVAGIFLMAGSSVVSQVSTFNPYSLLHIPLYGILAFLLYFSFSPVKCRSLFLRKGPGSHNRLPITNGGAKRSKNAINQQRNATAALVKAGLIASVIAIADEWHQSFIPSRDGSFSDVFLDIGGIVLALFLIRKWLNRSEAEGAIRIK